MSDQTLHLDIGIANTTVTTMKDNATQIEDLTKQLQAKINDFVGTNWQGNAAVQFQTEFDTWFNKVTVDTGELTSLADKLSTEIQNWEAAAAQLGG